MPRQTFAAIQGEASRLGTTDAALISACWLVARARIETDATSPALLSSASGAVYFAVAASVRDDALAVAQSHERSLSWVFLKAWDMVRAQVAALRNGKELARWRA